jgi:hypothetical protein
MSSAASLRRRTRPHHATLLALAVLSPATWAQQSVYYVCPGNVFTNTISQREADQRGCKAREAQQPNTVVSTPVKPRPVGTPPSAGSGQRVEATEQRARDSDARRILELELQKEEAALEALRREYAGGEPERRGDEVRNPQKYIERVAELKAAIARKEADIAALKRELAKFGSAS